MSSIGVAIPKLFSASSIGCQGNRKAAISSFLLLQYRAVYRESCDIEVPGFSGHVIAWVPF